MWLKNGTVLKVDASSFQFLVGFQLEDIFLASNIFFRAQLDSAVANLENNRLRGQDNEIYHKKSD